MYEAFGNYIDTSYELRGVTPFITPSIEINSNDYPDSNDTIKSLELASSIHKEVRRTLQPQLKPGIKLNDIAKIIEQKTIELSNQSKSINKGIGFPVGLSINHCAAHYHPLPTDQTILTKSDIIKIDFGTEVNGWIVDSAFTICFDPKYDDLMEAVKEGTNTGIKNIGVDVNIGEWGGLIQEVIESYEISLNNQILPIKSIKNLGGHNIVKGIIHGGTFLPAFKMDTTNKFKEGVYAVETFCSTGATILSEVGDSTLFRLNPNNTNISNLKLDTTKNLLYKIKKSFETLPFTNRYCEIFNINNINNINNYATHLKLLTNSNCIHQYPPLCANVGDMTAQYEHTVYINETNKIVFSKGDDY